MTKWEGFSAQLLRWYDIEKRTLPWRETRDPYRIWVSEIMLQQTRVEAVRVYYARFLEALPTVEALAQCDEDELLKLWEGLGYYSRVRNLQKAAKIIVEKHDGKLPTDHAALLKLPGIGPYTAGAVASIAFDIPVVAMDGNVYRILSRLTRESGHVDDTKIAAKLKLLAEQLLSQQRPGEFNQALMDLGATVCIPNGRPDCENCPISAYCAAYAHGDPLAYAKKKPKKARKIVPYTILLMRKESEEAYLLSRRPNAGVLARMWSFPMMEGTLDAEGVKHVLTQAGYNVTAIEKGPDAKHVFTHLEWHMKSFVVSVSGFAVEREESAETTHVVREKGMDTVPTKAGSGRSPFLEDAAWASPAQIEASYAMPSAYRKFLTYLLREDRSTE